MLFLFQTSGILNYRDLQLIAPELIITIIACVALVIEVILPYKLSKWTAYFSLGGVALALVSLGAQFLSMGGTFRFSSLPTLTPMDGFYEMVHVDGFALIFRAIFLIAVALAIAISIRYLDIEREQHGEYYALLLFATVGMMFLAVGYDLISLYIALELMALTFYVLVAFTKRERRSNEAGMKYFLLGAFSSGILLYGMSVLYGITGSTNLGKIGNGVGEAMRLVGAATDPKDAILGFKPLLLMLTKARRLRSPRFFQLDRKPPALLFTRASFLSRSGHCKLSGRRCWVWSPRSRSWSATGRPLRRRIRSGCSLILQSRTRVICCWQSSRTIRTATLGWSFI